MAAVAHDDDYEHDEYDGVRDYDEHDEYDGVRDYDEHDEYDGVRDYDEQDEHGVRVAHGEEVLSLAREQDIAEILGQSWSTPTQAALDQVTHGLSRLCLPAEVRQALLAVLTSTAAHHDPRLLCAQRDLGGQLSGDGVSQPTVARVSAPVASTEAICDQAVLAAAHGTRVLAGFAESVLVDTARTLADRAGQELLARKHLADPGQLSATAREKWRAQTKSLVAQELSVLTGHGIQAAHAIVGFALAPPASVAAATSALRAGTTDWRAVSAFWSRCATFEHTAAGDVDTAVFGPLVNHPTPTPDTPQTDGPDSADAERVAGDGVPGQDVRRESWATFSRRLEREAVRVESSDQAAARAKRRAALSRRDVHARIGDHGTGDIIVTGSTTSIAGAVERIETIARAARAAGDQPSLGQIRSDTAFALLVHGILPLPGATTSCTGTCTASSTRGTGTNTTPSAAGSAAGSAFSAEPLLDTPEDITRIITGQPAVSVEVIVPASFVSGHPHTHTGPGLGPGGRNPDAATSTSTSTGTSPGTGAKPARARPGGVAEIVGYGFLGAEHARELVLTPGSTLHRLLTDPADGRLIERSISAYRPDQAMITQLRAADVFCRAPGCLVPARRCDLDHEHEHGEGGRTAEPNLGHKHRAHHQVKTAKFWTTIMNSTRHVSWRTLFGRMYVTDPHDYRQYDPPPHDSTPGGSTPGSPPEGSAPEGSAERDWVDPTDITDPDTRDQLIYAALSTRTSMDQWLHSIDDDPTAWRHSHDRPLTLLHHADGRRRPGPPPGQPDPDQLINPTPPPTPAPGPPPPF